MDTYQQPKRSFTEILRDTGKTAKGIGTGLLNFAQDNPALVSSLVALTNMAFTDKENRTGLSHPMVQAGITYALLKGAPLLKNVGNLVGNANYATLEAQALMAKGNHLADTFPSAPLFFGRKKALAKIQQDAINKGNQVFYDAYQKHRASGRLTSDYAPHQIEQIKQELKNIS